jgi:hypothetical protein
MNGYRLVREHVEHVEHAVAAVAPALDEAQ